MSAVMCSCGGLENLHSRTVVSLHAWGTEAETMRMPAMVYTPSGKYHAQEGGNGQ